MKALQITRAGSLDALAIRDVPDPKRGVGEAIVRVEAAGVNPSDVGIALGRFPQLTSIPARCSRRRFRSAIRSNERPKRTRALAAAKAEKSS